MGFCQLFLSVIAQTSSSSILGFSSVSCTTYLVDEALDWFHDLEPGSINDFEELSERFLDHFAASRAFHQKAASLFRIRQEPGETLRDYLNRFTKEAIKVKSCHRDVKMHAAINGLKPGDFANYVARKNPESLDELRKWAVGFIEMEESNASKVQIFGSTTESKGKDEQLADLSARPPRSRRDRGKDRANKEGKGQYKSPHSRFESYTPLNARRDVILQEIYNTGLVTWPKNAGKHPPLKEQTCQKDVTSTETMAIQRRSVLA